LSEIGFGKGILIQPTIWSDKDKVLHSLSRDITWNRKAWYSKSTDHGRTWMNPVSTEIDNHNNSIIVIDGTNLVIWNKGSDRNDLQLGRLSADYQSAEPILKLNTSGGGSYPNYCICNDRIEIVHTEMKAQAITRHIITMEELYCLPDTLPKNFLTNSNHNQLTFVPEPESWRSNEAL
jgi:predicted neuraminidase